MLTIKCWTNTIEQLDQFKLEMLAIEYLRHPQDFEALTRAYVEQARDASIIVYTTNEAVLTWIRIALKETHQSAEIMYYTPSGIDFFSIDTNGRFPNGAPEIFSVNWDAIRRLLQ